ncbi:MAG TPA: PP2C family serine/threonine-protein phosphatase [Terriglobales bacterium]|jgi:PPM family protein phosphatase|nr:PP2C family serine/threonine-protein phosphatase [Terriglobales bacterium]
MRIRPGVELAGLSDVGCQRENNEDRYAYWEPASEQQFKQRGRLAVVADGMGGYEGGQEASRIAVEVIEDVYANTPGSDIQALLITGFHLAHHRIQEHAREHPELLGMGTTCTAIALLDKLLYYAHVGDSRLYLVRDSRIFRLTRDHSYVGRLIENGVISQEEAESHPQRHILTAAMGAGAVIAPDNPDQPIQLMAGDVLVLCTDGLWSLLTDSEIIRTVEDAAPSDACKALVEIAKKRGGPDNITVEVLRISADSAK